MCLWDSMLFRVWYSKWVISVGINIELLFSCKNNSVYRVTYLTISLLRLELPLC